jgi:hypothetical protein
MARPQRKESKAADFIRPAIRSNGEKHVLEEIFEGDEDAMPTLKSVGFVKLKPGSTSWVSYTLITKGKEVLSMEVDEPNLRDIAEESAKIAFVSAFTEEEF